jgi:hypothetical protein
MHEHTASGNVAPGPLRFQDRAAFSPTMSKSSHCGPTQTCVPETQAGAGWELAGACRPEGEMMETSHVCLDAGSGHTLVVSAHSRPVLDAQPTRSSVLV